MPLLGIDVSEFQGQPDWPAVAGSGLAFAIARVSYGSGYTDRSYGWNRPRIPSAGLVPGAYHYLTGEPVAAQADLFCSLADPAAVHALDVEASALDVAGWVARYRTHFPGHPLLIYTGRDLWSRATGGTVGGPIGPLWLAGYRPNTYIRDPAGGTVEQLWASANGRCMTGLPFGGWDTACCIQIADTATVPGISGPVDADVWLGTTDELRALTGATVALTQDDLNKIAATVWSATFGGSPSTGVLLQRAAAPLDVPGLVAAIVAALPAPPAAGGLTVADVEGAAHRVLAKLALQLAP